MTDRVEQFLTFIQYDIPPLKSGEYTVTAKQTVNQQGANTFTATKRFAVPGNRFRLNGDDIASVFPAPLANGEFSGVMPLVVLRRKTLPWQRTPFPSDPSKMDVPWLAILVFMEGEQPTPAPATAADLLRDGYISIFSRANQLQLDPGQTASDPCTIIDISADLFSRVCPSATDLPFLAHIREVDTFDTVDHDTTTQEWAVVLGNRWPAPGKSQLDVNVHAFLVSLENMGDYLPNDDGTASAQLPPGSKVRLICYRTWRFAANDLGEKFKSLCENLNRDAEGNIGLTTLRLPAATPDRTAVAAAVTHQVSGQLTGTDADVLIRNGLCLGYTALGHHLREAGSTVSWCRGPLVPYPVTSVGYSIAACPDALLRYDPQTGLFDATYAQAWQLGQLLALQSPGFSVALYDWKQSLQKGIAAQEEMALIQQKLGGADVFSTFFAKRSTRLAALPTVPGDIADWIGRLKLLKGVPFSALVPDEGMLPVESMRFFYLDMDWMAAIVDGAFSIGRAGTTGTGLDVAPLAQANAAAQLSARRQRKNHRPHLAAKLAGAADEQFEIVTGCLLRSQLVSGFPQLQMNGYADTDGKTELPKLRMERLSDDVVVCLFEGELSRLDIHEPPEQLHCGVEGDAVNGYTTTLRHLTDADAGTQFGGDPVAVSVRPDGQTLQAAATARSILSRLNSNDCHQDVAQMTSAEFAVEMNKGSVRVEFVVKAEV